MTSIHSFRLAPVEIKDLMPSSSNGTLSLWWGRSIHTVTLCAIPLLFQKTDRSPSGLVIQILQTRKTNRWEWCIPQWQCLRPLNDWYMPNKELMRIEITWVLCCSSFTRFETPEHLKGAVVIWEVCPSTPATAPNDMPKPEICPCFVATGGFDGPL